MGPESYFEQVSYLRARDPSIISYNRAKFTKIRCNLRPFMNDTVIKVGADACVKIYLRLKGDVPVCSLYKVENSTFSCEVPHSYVSTKHLKDGEVLHKKYTFSKIFPSEAPQTEIFDLIVKQKMFDLINGYNSSLLAYGASGSGKTYTIVGTECNPGVIPRALEYLFRSLPPLDSVAKVQAMENGSIKHLSLADQINARDTKEGLIKYFDKQSTAHMHKETYKMMQQRLSEQPTATVDVEASDVCVAVWISFAEIYNEHIYDLLKPHTQNRPKLTLRSRKKNGETYIKDLTSVFVSTGLEAYQILRYGLTNLNYAATALNDHSSRSHCIFTIQLVQVCSESPEGCISTFNFCDLAGSERLKKTKNVGDRLKESNNINASLLVLGRCLKEVRDSQKHKDTRTIPFRDSKLTKLFQYAISGRETLSMIVNVNPSEYMYSETQHVLNFSAIAMEVKIEQKPKPVRLNSVTEDAAHERILELEDMLEQLQDHVLTMEEKRHANINKYLEMFRTERDENNRKWQERLNEKVHEKTREYEEEIQELYAKIRSIENGYKSESSIIEIADSDEEDSTPSTSQSENKQLKQALKEKEEIEINYKEMEKRYRELEEKCKEVEAQLESAKTNVRIEKRESTKRLERVIELEEEIEFNRSLRYVDSEDSESDDSDTTKQSK